MLNQNTVNSLIGARQSGRLRKVVSYGKDQQNNPNAGLINLLCKNITLSAKIRQIETNLLDFFTCNKFSRKVLSRVYCTCQCVSY